MRISTSISILVSAMSAPKDLEKISKIQIVFSKKSMRLLSKCLSQLSLPTSNREFSAAMVVSDQLSKISRALSRFKDHLKSNLDKITQRIIKKS